MTKVLLLAAILSIFTLGQATATSNKIAPMTFTVVRSVKPGCEPNCPQWLAAEGLITAGSAAQFKLAVSKLGNLKLPIIINSPGGDVRSAVEMGKLIRKRKLSTGVGITDYVGCRPTDKACKLTSSQRGIFSGTARDEGSYCFSACPLVLAGGIERIAGPSASLGVHQVLTSGHDVKITYRESYRIVNGKKKIIGRKIISRKNINFYEKVGMTKQLRVLLVPYLKQMGVSEELFAEMEKASPSSINVPEIWKDKKIGLITSIFPLVVLTGNSNCSPPKNAPNCVLLQP